jgi:hypothetical protein
VKLKEGVVCQQQDKTLTHGASGTENTYNKLGLDDA